MLKTQKKPSLFWPALVIILLAIAVGTTVIPVTIQECQQYSSGNPKQCADYDIGPFLISWIVGVVNKYNGMVTALATVAIAVFTLTLWRVTSRTVELARDEFYASHRPFIRVRNINVRKVNGVTVESTSGGIRYVKSGEIFSGQFYVANIGRADCRLTGAYLTFWAGAYGLPMARPYEGRNENLTVPAGNMTAGWRWPVPFNIAFDTSGIGIGETVYPDRTDVFAMGWVEYIDDAHRGYRTTFCRWYDPDRRRFMPYADAGHDYEAEE